jgi:hypothetical protein
MSHTDRQLLEWAAKAAGIILAWEHHGVCVGDFADTPYETTIHGRDGGYSDEIKKWPWDPLSDDGDALRLAVKLGLFVTFEQEQCGAISAAWVVDGDD